MGIENRGRKAVPYAQKRYEERGANRLSVRFGRKSGQKRGHILYKKCSVLDEKSALRVCF